MSYHKKSSHFFPSFVMGLVFMVTLVFLCYMPALDGPMIMDDKLTIRDNACLYSIEKAVMQQSDQVSAVTGRPLTALSFVFFKEWRRDEYIRADRLFNLSLHAGTAILSIFFLLHFFRGKISPFLIVAGVFWWSLHPIHAQTVNYLCQRSTLLYTFFLVLALLFQVKAISSYKSGFSKKYLVFVAGMSLSLILSVCSKQTAVAAPIIVYAFWWHEQRKVSRKAAHLFPPLVYLFGLVVPWFFLGLLLLTSNKIPAAGFETGISSLAYFKIQLAEYWSYFYRFLYPSQLAVDYGITVATTGPNFLYGAVVMSFFLFIAYCSYKQKRGSVFVLIASAGLLMAPTSSFYPIITEVAADRRVYLPSLFLLFSVIYSLKNFIKEHFKADGIMLKSVPLVLIFLSLIYGALTYNRSSEYRTLERLWQSNVEAVPENERGWFALADSQLINDKYDESLISLNKALDTGRDPHIAHQQIGDVFYRTSRLDQAIGSYEKAVEIHPKFQLGWVRLAEAYYSAKRFADAEKAFSTGSMIDGRNSHLKTKYIIFLSKVGKFDQAYKILDELLNEHPEDPRLSALRDSVAVSQERWLQQLR